MAHVQNSSLRRRRENEQAIYFTALLDPQNSNLISMILFPKLTSVLLFICFMKALPCNHYMDKTIGIHLLIQGWASSVTSTEGQF